MGEGVELKTTRKYKLIIPLAERHLVILISIVTTLITSQESRGCPVSIYTNYPGEAWSNYYKYYNLCVKIVNSQPRRTVLGYLVIDGEYVIKLCL